MSKHKVTFSCVPLCDESLAWATGRDLRLTVVINGMCAAPVRWSFAFNQVLFHYSQSFLCAFAREWNFELSEATPRDFVTFSMKEATKRIYGNRKSQERNSLDYNKALTLIAKSVGRELSDLLLSHSTTVSYLLHYERQNPLLAFSSKGLLMKYFPWAGSRRRWKKL